MSPLRDSANPAERPDSQQNLSDDLYLRYAADRGIARIAARKPMIPHHEDPSFRYAEGQIDVAVLHAQAARWV